jgi:hypothetical protein
VSEMLRISEPGKRGTLLLALMRQSSMRCRDELTEMMLRRILKTQAAAKQKLEDLKDRHRGIEEGLIGVLHQVLRTDTVVDPPKIALISLATDCIEVVVA